MLCLLLLYCQFPKLFCKSRPNNWVRTRYIGKTFWFWIHEHKNALKILTSTLPTTPASSCVSRMAASSTVSSVSQPPCSNNNRSYSRYCQMKMKKRMVKSEWWVGKMNGTFGNIIPCPFCELITRTSKSSMEEDWQLVSLYLYGMHLHNLEHKHKKHTLLIKSK